MEPTKEWFDLLDEKKELLQSPVDLERYFSENKIADYTINTIELGDFTSTSGHLIAVDPLGFIITEDNLPYFEVAPTGTFKSYASIMEVEDPETSEKANLIASYKIEFAATKPVYYREALKGNEDLTSLSQDEYFGFATDSGLATVFDVDAFPQITEIIDKIEDSSEEANVYDDYFEPLFLENVKNNPTYQSEEGDWINWSVPESAFKFPIMQAGFGEGVYPVYFGYDENHKIVALYIQYIDAEMEIEEDEEYL